MHRGHPARAAHHHGHPRTHIRTSRRKLSTPQLVLIALGGAIIENEKRALDKMSKGELIDRISEYCFNKEQDNISFEDWNDLEEDQLRTVVPQRVRLSQCDLS